MEAVVIGAALEAIFKFLANLGGHEIVKLDMRPLPDEDKNMLKARDEVMSLLKESDK